MTISFDYLDVEHGQATQNLKLLLLPLADDISIDIYLYTHKNKDRISLNSHKSFSIAFAIRLYH